MANPKRVQQQPLQGKIAIVCGASKGIGRATAGEIVQLGGSVCLVARDARALHAAAADLERRRTTAAQFVEAIACDTTDMERLQSHCSRFVQQHGVPDYLLNVVGYAYPQYMENLTLDDFRRNMDVNYYGQLVPILVWLPHFMQARKGHIANVSSMMGFFGIVGYAAYAPTKFAIVGLTEVLRHELKPYNIACSILYPPDTATPGFEAENRSKPEETRLISAASKTLTAEEVAEVFVEGILQRRFHILPGEARWVWMLYRLFPGLVRLVLDREFRKARQGLGKT
jgi:3-dehydrosphinganine reductase